LSHKVRAHTRRTASGRTVTVRQHRQEDPAAAQRKRDAFERRVLRERQEAAHPGAYTRAPRRTAGERRRKKRGLKPARAKRHAKKALRLWRRHKVKAVLYAALALGEITAWAAHRGVTRAVKVIRKLRQGRKRRRKR
jgi:hypothetical protein